MTVTRPAEGSGSADMDDEPGQSAGVAGGQGPLAYRALKGLWTAGAAMVVGMAAGLLMILQRPAATCAASPGLREGEIDFRCFSHPHALNGVAVTAAFVGLGAIVYLAWILITALDARSGAQT